MVLTDDERDLIADAALSRWATGDDKSFCEAFDHPEEVGVEPPLSSWDEARAFLDQHRKILDWTYNNLHRTVAASTRFAPGEPFGPVK